MKEQLDQVLEFHRVIGAHVVKKPTMDGDFR